MTKSLKGLIFDMDGLMFDTERLSTTCWVKVGEENGFPITRKLIDSTRGLDRRKTAKILETEFGEGFDFQRFSDKTRAYMDEEIFAAGMPIKKGLPELLAYAQNKGYLCAVASSSERERVDFYLRTAKLTQYFAVTVCGDEIEKGKPEPDIFLKAAEKMGLKPEACMVLEDSQYGIKAAVRAGMPAVLIPDMIMPKQETRRAAYAEKTSLLEVIDLLEEA